MLLSQKKTHVFPLNIATPILSPYHKVCIDICGQALVKSDSSHVYPR